MIRPLITTALLLVLNASLLPSLHAQSTVESVPLKQIISRVEAKSPFRFLYRESLVAGIRLSLRGDADSLISRLPAALAFYHIDMRVDSSRHQVFLLPMDGSKMHSKSVSISGRIVDARTGEPLPFATLSWKIALHNSGGLAADASGYFQAAIPLPAGRDTLGLTASYLGYFKNRFHINTSQNRNWEGLTLRLQPQTFEAREIVVHGSAYYTTIDTSLQGLVRTQTFNPLGESNAVRALQVLPSVSQGTALNDGLHVRGSSTDGFQVLLDGVEIYNQSHLFGLLDSFNADALKTSAFFYDVTPARYSVPSGGLLSLVTRSGSQNSPHFQAGVSNTAVKATAETPLFNGSGSLLLSARHSYMNSLDWFNNRDLIGWGLDISRDREIVDTGDFIEIEDRLVIPGDYKANFYDYHGKMLLESAGGGRITLSGYLGGDETSQEAQRYYYATTNGPLRGRFELEPVSAGSKWGNSAASFNWKTPVASRIYHSLQTGYSYYHTSFNKDDYAYLIPSSTRQLRASIHPYSNRSHLFDFNADDHVDGLLGSSLSWTAGASWHYYNIQYHEEAFTRPEYERHFESHLFEPYLQLDYRPSSWIKLDAGGRLSWFSDGSWLRLSPRFLLQLFPDHPVSFKAGYSRNYQWLNRISVYNISSADVWIPATSQQPPTSIDYWSAGIYLRGLPHTFIQLEAYLKDYRNIRLHEINVRELANTYSEAPWYYNNDGLGKGIELLMRNQFRRISLTQSFAFSEMTMQNPNLNDGESFHVSWDRTYRYNTVLDYSFFPGFNLFASWMWASGVPNRLALAADASRERLGVYHRLDAGLHWQTRLGSTALEMQVSAYNLYNRSNPWYREYTLTFDRDAQMQRRISTHTVEVYDLGFQPSFEMRIRF